MRLKYLSMLTALLVLMPAVGQAEERSLFLQKVYMSFCLKHFDDYGALRADLIGQGLPRLSAEQGANFLQGQGGDVWPVPYEGQFGQFVLALPEGDRECSVMARYADLDHTEQWFSILAGTAPEPLEVQQSETVATRTPLTGPAHRHNWRWIASGAEQGLRLTLVTADDPKAAIQAWASLTLTQLKDQER